MVEQLFSNPDIFRIDVHLPNSPLRNLNCYVICSGNESLIIDTGYNRPECLQAMQEGLDELHIDLKQARLFLTHLHADHIGLTEYLCAQGVQVLMGAVDYEYLELRDSLDGWRWMEERFQREGLSPELVALQRSLNPARAFAPGNRFPARTVEDGEIISVGPHRLRCIHTPGHTPGHTCLYLESEKLLFSGDHILFDISPNITMWRYVEDSLGSYLESLKKIRTLDIRTTLPAHRQNHMDVYERIDQLLEHHEVRLAQIMSIVEKEPGMNACEIGSRMSWRMRGRNWEEFPIQQKWFAIGETVSHLDYLVLRGRLLRRESETEIRYFLP